MKKTTFITIITIFAVILFGVSSFADNNNNNNIAQDAVDGVRNVVGGAENAIEGAANGIGNGIRNGMSAVGNTMQDAGNNMREGMTTDTNNNNYDATRTTTTRTITTANDTNTILGMGPRAWSLFTLATLGIITVGLVWYYGKQNEIKYQHDDENY